METSEPIEPTSQEQRSAEFKQFALDLIDERYGLEASIKEKATNRSIILSGYSRDDLQLPEYLDLPRAAEGIPGVMSFEAQSINGETVLSKITIQPEDGAPLSIRDDHGIIVQESGDIMSPLPGSALNETLFSLFPKSVQYKLTVDNAIEVISQLSPESSAVFEFEDDAADFLTRISVSDTETVNDSIFSLEVVKTIIHPSGQLVGTRMNLSESIQRQIKKADVTHNAVSLDLNQSSSPIIEVDFFDNFLDGKIMPVALPTHRHIGDILDALARLRLN